MLFAEHRRLRTDFRIAVLLECQTHGDELLVWETDEELAGRRLRAEVDGTLLPVRPDAFFAIARVNGRGHSAFMVEAQVESRPATYQRIARAVMAFFGSGAYAEAFSFRSLRVLALSPTRAKAVALRGAAEAVGGESLFWSATLGDVWAAPLRARVWLVGGSKRLHAVFEEE